MTDTSTATSLIVEFLEAYSAAIAAGYDVAAPTADLRRAITAMTEFVENARREREAARLDDAIIADLTGYEAESLSLLADGIVDIAADDVRSLRLAGLIEGTGDDIDLTPRGERITRRLAG